MLHRVSTPDRVHFVALSDGVGSHACDWAASETAVNSAAECFSGADGTVQDRLRIALDRAHQDVHDLTGKKAGATATLVLLAWAEGEDVARFLCVGDSRLYKISLAGVEMLTEDDSVSVPLKIDGKVVLGAGAVKFTSGITRAVGFASLGDVEVLEVPLLNGEMLAAVTDGFHELSGFEGKLESLFDHTDLAAGCKSELVRAHVVGGRDDASAVLLRRSEFPQSDRDEYMSAIRAGTCFREAGLYKHLMARVCVDHVAGAVADGLIEEIDCCLDYMLTHNIVPIGEELLPSLDILAESREVHAKAVLDKFVGLVMKGRS